MKAPWIKQSSVDDSLRIPIRRGRALAKYHSLTAVLLGASSTWGTGAFAQDAEAEPQDPNGPEEEVPESDASASAKMELGSSGLSTDGDASSKPAGDTSETPAVPPYAGARATRKSSTASVGERFKQLPYMERYLPEANLWEVGMFGGLFFPSAAHNLKVAVLPREEFAPLAMQLGGRLAYYPLSFVGAELEAFGGGGAAETSNFSAVFYGVRAHVIAQLPFYSVVPFLLVGGGALGASTETMGHDRDPAFHFGGGVKVPFHHIVGARLDIRDTLSQKGNGASNGKQTHHPSIHLGVTFTFERTPPSQHISDIDYDGLYDHEDKCPDQGALTIDGCPLDSDGDGLVDPEDACPHEASNEPDGCPNLDTDGDGIPIPVDQCPDEAGPPPTGCVNEDPDGDGILGAADKCPDEPETRNGFEDDDGCPDEMPDAVKRFTGIIQGINFKQGTAEIEPTSFETLDATVEILKKYPSIRLEVSGHTSSEGTDARNQELSVQRAEAVRSYFINKGIAEDRLAARGAGPSEPVADNGTRAGRQQNRRIEFRILSQP